jgi:hypothetical protein
MCRIEPGAQEVLPIRPWERKGRWSSIRANRNEEQESALIRATREEGWIEEVGLRVLLLQPSPVPSGCQ